MKNFNTRVPRWLVACAVTLLAGCVHQPPSLYQWGSYQSQVYGYFKGESPEDQILALEQDIQAMAAADRPPPPGFHAHLGMLYAATGQDGKAQESLLSERTRYPESATYIDLLLQKYQR